MQNIEVVYDSFGNQQIKLNVFSYDEKKLTKYDIKKYYEEFGRMPPTKKEVYNNQYR